MHYELLEMPIIQYKKVYTFNTIISVDTFFELLLWSTSDAKCH